MVYGSGPFAILPFSKLFLPQIKCFMVTTILTDDLLGSRLKTIFILTILRKVNGENEWEMYFR